MRMWAAQGDWSAGTEIVDFLELLLDQGSGNGFVMLIAFIVD